MRVGNVSIRGANRQLIEATTTVDDRIALIKFAQPVSPEHLVELSYPQFKLCQYLDGYGFYLLRPKGLIQQGICQLGSPGFTPTASELMIAHG